MDMQLYNEKKKKRKMKYLAEQGHPGAREYLNKSGFNKTPMHAAKSPVLSDGESLMRGHDVEERGDIPQKSEMYSMHMPQSTKPPEKAGLLKFETQAQELRENERPEPKPMHMKHGKRIFARDPNYNPEPTTPAPNGPGTKQTNMAVGAPKKSLNTYPAGGPGGTSDGVGGPMMTSVKGHTSTGPAPSNFSHRNQEHASQGAPPGLGPVPGNGPKSLTMYPGKKKKKSHRAMAFVGRQGPGNYGTGSPA